jgi:hypothetical protein
MDAMVLCICRHPLVLHDDDRGCRAARYRPCPCVLGPRDALDSAIDAVRIPGSADVPPATVHK